MLTEVFAWFYSGYVFARNLPFQVNDLFHGVYEYNMTSQRKVLKKVNIFLHLKGNVL